MDHITLVPAGAGSGKTHRIETELSSRVISGEIRAHRILAVTFTEAAASELRGRLRKALLEHGRVEDALAIDRAYVGTIHGLGQRLLTEHAFAAGRSPALRLVSEAERDLLIRAEIPRSEALAPVAQDPARFGYAWSFGSDKSAEEQFRDDVLKALDVLRGLGEAGLRPDLLDGALDRLDRIAEADGDATAMTDRLRRAAQALHRAFPDGIADAATNDTARKAWIADRMKIRRAATEDSVLEHDWKLWQQLRGLRLTKRGAPTPEGYDDLAQVVIDAADELPRHPGPLQDARIHLTALVHGAQQIAAAYAQAKRAGGLIDYADMVAEAEALLRTRPEIRDAVLAEIDCVVIDEFQDTNPVQFSLLWTLARHAKRALIVGDAKQAIMGFQGADPRLSQALNAAMPDQVQAQDRNWRSVPGIMDFVNAAGPGLFPDRYDPLAPERKPGAAPFLEALPIVGGRGADAVSEPDGIAERVARMIDDLEQVHDPRTDVLRPVRPDDVAVLCFTHKKALKQAEALRRLGLPVAIPESGWREGRAVRVACAAIAFAADPGDRLAALTLAVMGPARRPLNQALTTAIEDGLEADPSLAPLAALAEQGRRLSVADFAARALAAAGLHAWAAGLPEAPAELADLARFEAEAAAFDALPETLKAAAGLPASGPLAFLGWLAAQTDKDFDKRPDPSGRWAEGIEVCTWHAAKGHEWPVVIVSGLDQGFADWPRTLRAEFNGFEDLDDVLAHAGLSWTPAFVAPEVQARFLADRRAADEAQACAALYVAMTRARDRMVLSLPKPGKTDSRMIDLLRERTGLETEGGEARLGGATLPCAMRQAMAGEARPPRVRPQLLTHAPPRPAIAAGGLWRRSPSSLVATPDAAPAEVRTIDLGVPVADRPGAFALATERGTAWHLAFRTLLQRPDLADRLGPATGLDPAALAAIAAQAGAVKGWLAAQGFEELHFELPLHARAPDGSETRAVIDCLALGPAGACILDHKSGPALDPAARFAGYLPQLEAYASLASYAFPDRPVRMLAINWMSEGRLSTRECRPTPEQSGRRRMERAEM